MDATVQPGDLIDQIRRDLMAVRERMDDQRKRKASQQILLNEALRSIEGHLQQDLDAEAFLQGITAAPQADPVAVAGQLSQEEAELLRWIEHKSAPAQSGQSLPRQLECHPTLRQVVKECLLARLAEDVHLGSDDWPQLTHELWEGLPGPPPRELTGDWLRTLPTALQPILEKRWTQLRLNHWRELTYGERVERYFLEHANNLEQVVFSMIRVEKQGTALELYLRLLDESAHFNELARQFSAGEERFTLGVIGPRAIGGLHPEIQAAIRHLSVGELHKPLQIDCWFVLVRLESRQPASFDATTRLRLLDTMLDQDLEAVLSGHAPPHGASLHQGVNTGLLPRLGA
jgi:parvulin-like peptidyl-prolyl isomerase